jgi:hypothetical protein
MTAFESSAKVTPPLTLAERGVYKACEAGEAKAKVKGRRNCKKAHETCMSSFDSLGWADWNAWRAKLSLTAVRAVGLGRNIRKTAFGIAISGASILGGGLRLYLESVMEAESPF